MPIAGVGKLKPSFPFRSPLQLAVTVVPTDGFKSYSSPTKRDYELSKAQNVTHEGSWQKVPLQDYAFLPGFSGSASVGKYDDDSLWPDASQVDMRWAYFPQFSS